MDEFKELYENLSPNKLSIENVTQLETKVEILEQEVKQLEAALNKSELDKRNLNKNYERDKKNLLKNHESVLANISSLFTTAKKEIERKNNTIKELRQQLDDLIFRRRDKRLPPQNEVVQSQNEDDAICAKPVNEDRPVASVIRPSVRNHRFSDREKSSSGDKSPLPARISSRPYENGEKDERVDYSRVKCVENAAPECRFKDYNELKFPQSKVHGDSPDDHFYSKNSTDSYPYRKSNKKIREADDRDHRICRNAKEKHRYSPYEHRKEDHERSRFKHHRHERDHRDEEYSQSRAKRSSYDRNRHEFGDGHRTADSRQEVECVIRLTKEDRRSDHSGRATSDDRRREAESSAKKSIDDRRREDLAFQKLIARSKENVTHRKSVHDGSRDNPARQENLTNLELTGRKSIENRQRENVVNQPEHSGRKLFEDRRKENPAHLEIAAKKPPCHQTDLVNSSLVAKKLVSDRKKDFAAAKLGGQKSIVDLKRGIPLDPKRVNRKPNGKRPTENAANSSQSVVDNQVPSGSQVEGGYPVDGQMKAVDILAQYGVYATPYKLLNGDKCTFAGFKLVSPIADTPDHLKALFNNPKIKVSPIPMINERRVLNSPAKEPVIPAKAAEKDPAANKNSNEEPSKKMLADDSSASPSPGKLLLLNTVTTSPFKNCCIVKVKAELANNSPAETAVKEPVTVSGTDSTNAEHGVFTRKRRAPVIRHIKKAET